MAGEAEDRGDKLSAENEAAAQALAEAAESAQTAADGAADKSGEDKEAVAAVDEGAQPRNDKGQFVPKARFDDQIAKERTARETAERALAELQAQLKTSEASADVAKLETEIVALEQAHAKAMLEGDSDKAAALSSQIRMKERTIQVQQSSDLSNRAKVEAREEIRMDTAIERLEAAYPQLDSKHDDFDQDLVDLVLGTQLQLINVERMSPSQALTAAAAKVMAKVLPASKDGGEATGLSAAKKAATDRKTAQIDKNIDTAKKQPASLKDTGVDTDKAGFKGDLDVEQMSFEEFSALPEATKSRLRGDLVE